ncbi:MAG TPA: hypothetical protein VNX21_09165 [Candidatus Thermoplasmatota archaeon]|nr:hypothetical protein [Candidatus Thermoplasmatota archaeon]
MRSIPALILLCLLALPASAAPEAGFAEADESCAVEVEVADCRLAATATLVAWCETRFPSGEPCFVRAVGEVAITDAAPARLAYVSLRLGGAAVSQTCHAVGVPESRCAFDVAVGTDLPRASCLPVTLAAQHGPLNPLPQARVGRDYVVCRAADGPLSFQ